MRIFAGQCIVAVSILLNGLLLFNFESATFTLAAKFTDEISKSNSDAKASSLVKINEFAQIQITFLHFLFAPVILMIIGLVIRGNGAAHQGCRKCGASGNR
jgi:hypothetical protein